MKLTHAKLGIINSDWYRKLCNDLNDIPEFQQVLANKLEVDKRYLSLVLNGKFNYKTMQERISKEIGISVGELFGSDAWFRVAATKLKDKEREAAKQPVAC